MANVTKHWYDIVFKRNILAAAALERLEKEKRVVEQRLRDINSEIADLTEIRNATQEELDKVTGIEVK